jgi:lysylphosphatidylglycerol synthetase-like protein (DUF2156 family)
MTNPLSIRSRVEWFYLLLALIGLVLPLRHFLRFLVTEGMNLSLFFGQLFQNDISSFFAMDLFVSAIALWVFVFVEGRRRRMKGLWIYVVCTMIVGVSLALPLFLFFRERART